jgi:xanthine dehydrogenase YagT iron-sulfur-binding subunit
MTTSHRTPQPAEPRAAEPQPAGPQPRGPQPAEPRRVTPRPVKAGAGERIEVRLTVNGAPAVLAVAARVTLADALRDHLGLTGTHLGCEHGVCGMCTVLVDGEAARACLLLAPQADGAEITTVEGLGSPEALHPLQESFGRHHALQCGFCTPGFLMSSYDLLTSNPGVSEEDLPAELSGVICRCTGYRNILAAVREVRASYPDGPPAPGNSTRRALVGRAAGAHQAPAQPGADEAPPGEAPGRPAEIVLPDGDPSVAVQVSTEISVAADQVWQVLDDAHRLARCLPGAELTEDLGGGRYAGRARVSAGPVKLAFRGVAHIVERDRDRQRMRVLAQGQDTGGAQTHAEIVLRTEPTAAGTTLRADARVYLTGRIAQFGRSLAGDVSRRLFAQFADAVAEAAASGRAPRGPVAAPSAIRLLLSSLTDRIRRAFRRPRH